MKRIDIVFDESLENQMQVLLATIGIRHYTRLDNVTGAGDAGERLNNAVGPGRNAMLIVVADDDRINALKKAIGRFKATSPNSGVQGFVIPIESML